MLRERKKGIYHLPIFLYQTVQSYGRWKTCQLHIGTVLTMASLPNMHFYQLPTVTNYQLTTPIAPEMVVLLQSGGSSHIVRLREQNVPSNV